ncbi:MAG TPA: single-stranded DNA-binding protein [Sphingobacteriaceae bacterium]|nr:single-stranded DNA-binding protein [Sphingobacteriaceae bacterium]
MKNLVILIGRVGKDPEVRHLDNGKSVANLSLATSETYKNKQGEKVENTEWHNLVAWSPLAEIFEKYVKKGNQIYVEGKLTTRTWEKDGDKKYITEVVVKELVMLGGKEPQVGQAKDPRTEPNKTMVDDLEEDSLPF